MEDNYGLWQRKEAEEERWLAQRPSCAVCEESIQEDFAYCINGELICENCMDACLVDVEDYIG